MITITVKKEKDIILEVLIKGHAKYDLSGKDIVCASVSSIAITTINGILSLDEESISYEESSGYLKINDLKKDIITNKLLLNMINLFNDIESKYPKNIKMKRG